MYSCLREACVSAIKEKQYLGAISESEGFVDDDATSYLKHLEAIERVFNKAAEDDIPAEVCTRLFILDNRFKE